MAVAAAAVPMALVAHRSPERPAGASPGRTAATGASLAGSVKTCQAVALPTLGGRGGIATAASQGGVVVGMADNAAGRSRPVLWRNGLATPVSTGLPGSKPTSVNNAGAVVGYAVDGEDDESTIGWYWAHGTLIRLKGRDGLSADPAYINNHGVIVGSLVTPEELREGMDGPAQAAVWPSATARPRLLPPLPGDTGAQAYAVNERGQIGGVSGGTRFTPVVWDRRGHPSALRTLSGGWGIVFGLGDDGEATGVSSRRGAAQQPVIWDAAGTVRPAETGIVPAIAAHGVRLTPVSSGTFHGVSVTPNARSGASDVVGYTADSRGERRPTIWRCPR